MYRRDFMFACAASALAASLPATPADASPRFYARAWACLWLFVGLLLLTYWGFRWLPLPFLGWLVGHGVLVLLTQWNPHWDDMLVAQMNQRYKSRYSAG